MKYNFIMPAAFFCIAITTAQAQYTTDKVVGQKNEAILDSLKKATYPYLLPIWGQKVINKGFSLPLSAGVSMQYVWQQSDIVINNLQVGFNHGPKYNLDEIIRFDNAKTQTNGVNIRPDFWVLPFLNVYGLLAKSDNSTSIECGLWIPDSVGFKKAIDFSTKANFNSTTFGFGLTPTMGIGGFFLALDMNFTWSDIDELDKPAYIFVLGPRLGKNIKFKNGSSLAIWAGGFRVMLDNATNGSLNLSDLVSTDDWQNKIDSGYTKVTNSQNQVDTWWNNLSTTEQKNPLNIAKHETANAALTKASQFLTGASQAVNTINNSTVQYSLSKAPKDKWNFIIGTQYQINNRLMVRAEYGFLSSRKQFIGGVQYRFGL
jgi:hypothetical protein